MGTGQGPEVGGPTGTVAVGAVLALADDVWRIAIVSPSVKPVTVVPPHEPLRAIAVQPVPQVAVRVPENPLKVTALLEIVLLGLTPVWLVNVMASGPPPMIVFQLEPSQP